ncbi:MAG: tail fiber domain-containing protein [Candidatus Micrarchaeota archaeon]
MRNSVFLIVFFAVLLTVLVAAQTAPNPGHIGIQVNVLTPSSMSILPNPSPNATHTLQETINYIFQNLGGSGGSGYWIQTPDKNLYYNDGNVGIGTTSPVGVLEVASSGNTKLRVSSSTNAVPHIDIDNTLRSWQLRVAPDGNFSIRDNTAAGNRLTIVGNGNVGIGTASPLSGNKLEVAGAITGQGIFLNNARSAGFYDPGAGAVSVRAGNIDDAVRITQTGKVGIGTAGPTVPLDIVSPIGSNQIGLRIANTAGAFIQLVDGGTKDWALGVADGSNALTFVENRASGAAGTEVMRIAAGGNVGIGTTTPHTFLEVSKEIQIGSSVTPTSNFYITTKAIPATMGGLRVYNGNANAGETPTPIMTFAQWGGVGINTNNPGVNLDIRTSTLKTQNSPLMHLLYLATSEPLAGDAMVLRMGLKTSSDPAQRYADIDVNDGTLAGSLVLQSYGGNVGIGATSPSVPLDILAPVTRNQIGLRIANAGGAFIQLTDAGSKDWGFGVSDGTGALIFYEDRNPSAGGTERMRLQAGGGVKIFNLTTNGPVYSNAGVLTNTNPSSRDYKTNIQPVQLDSKRILLLQPKSFTWKANGQKDFGYIAEDLQQVLPELYRDDGTTKGYAADKLPFYTIELVKQQQAQINALTQIVCADHPALAYCQKP